MTTEEIKFKDWNEFLAHSDLYDASIGFDADYAFRGHADSDWKLEPTLYRRLKEEEQLIDEERAWFVEAQITDQFHNLVSPTDPAATDQGGFGTPPGLVDSDLWIRMQHYGAPTRLLDWSRSVFVALYFAVISEPEKDGAVWVLHGKSVRESLRKNDTRVVRGHFKKQFIGQKKIGWFEVFAPFDRLVAQQGLFTISTDIMMDHHRAFDDMHNDEFPLTKLIIPAKWKPEFLRKLISMNISAASLFPGLDGIGRSIQESIEVLLLQAKVDPGNRFGRLSS